MDASSFFSLELQRSVDNQNTLLRDVLDKLETSGIPQASECKELIKPSPQSLQEKEISELNKKLVNYPIPYLTYELAFTIIELHRRMLYERANLREQDKILMTFEHNTSKPAPRIFSLQASKDNPMGQSFLLTPDTTGLHVPPSYQCESLSFSPEKLIVKKEKVTNFISPYNLKLCNQPLLYMYHVSLSDFENEIIFFPNTTLINLPVSISNIVQRGIELGYNKNQLVILFKLFVSEYFSSYRYTLDNVTSQKQLFQQVLNIIHTQDLGTEVDRQLQAIVREPSDPIQKTFFLYRSLIYLKIKTKEPFLQEFKMQNKVSRLSQQAIVYFVENTVKDMYLKWLAHRNYNGDPPAESEILSFISRLEKDQPHLRLQSSKSVGDQMKSYPELYNSVFSHVTTRTGDHTGRTPTTSRPRRGTRTTPSAVTKNDHRRPRREGWIINKNYQGANDKNHRPRSRSQPTRFNSRSRSPSYSRSRSRGRDRSGSQYSQSRSQSPSRGPPRTYDRSRSPSPGRSWNRTTHQYPGQSSRYSSDQHKPFQNRDYGTKPKTPNVHNIQKQLNYLNKQLQTLSVGTPKCARCLGSHETDNCDLFSVTARRQCESCHHGRHLVSECRSSFSRRN